MQIESTTDTPEMVQAALAGSKVQGEETPETAVSAKETPGHEETVSSESSVSDESEELEESEESDAEESETSEEEEDQKDQPKQANGIQKRINKLTKKLSAKDQEIEFLKSQLYKAQPQEQKQETKTEAIIPTDKPNPDNYETTEEYFDALSDWKVDQKLQALEKANREKELRNQYDNSLNGFRQKSAEFEKTVDDFRDVIEDVNDIPMSLTVQEALMESENGPELLYRLAKEPEEYKRINQLSPLAAARAIGRFEAKILSESKSSDEKAKTVTKTKAPPPIDPVGPKATSGRKKTIYDEGLSQREYEKLRAEQLSKQL